MEGLAAFSVIFFLLALVLVVLWICLPFAVFGVKPLLTQIRDELRALHKLAEAGNAQQRVLIEQQKLELSRTGRP